MQELPHLICLHTLLKGRAIMKNMGIGSIIINVFTLLAGVAAIVWGFGAMQVDSSNWPSAAGQVTSSSGSNYSDSNDSQSTYEYTVDGVKFTGSSNTAYDVGQKIAVYYDPADPATSADSQGTTELYGCFGFIFGIWAVGSIAWNVVKIRRAAKQKDTA
jgi:hypothetical protein